MAQRIYGVKCKAAIDGVHVFPDTAENRRLNRKRTIVLDESAVARFGDDLIDQGPAAPDPETDQAPVTHNRQVTRTKTK
jgi:hypothetical protein